MKTAIRTAILTISAAFCTTGSYAQEPAAATTAETAIVAANTAPAETPAAAVATTNTKPAPVAPVKELDNKPLVVDTLPSINEAIKIVLFNDNTWRYVRDREIPQDSSIYVKYWDSTIISPYREVELSSLPQSVAIALVDSLKSYQVGS